LSQVDLSVLTFLWKWKVATTASLHAKFYAPRSLKGAYLRLNVLENDGFIQSHFDITGEKFLWSLTPLGFLAVRSQLPPLKEEGFLSEAPGHDLLSLAVMCGDWLISPREGVVLISEQQIRRYQSPFAALEEKSVAYQKMGSVWVSKGSWDSDYKKHRPDGLWCFEPKNGEAHVIALEVQLSPESEESYHGAGKFYESAREIKHVIWVVPAFSAIRKIIAGLSHGGELGTEKHQFITYTTFFEKGWLSPIEVGTLENCTLRHALNSPLGMDGIGDEESTSHKTILNTRKSPHMAQSPLFYRPGDQWFSLGRKIQAKKKPGLTSTRRKRSETYSSMEGAYDE
jgi:hypothetical protein